MSSPALASLLVCLLLVTLLVTLVAQPAAAAAGHLENDDLVFDHDNKASGADISLEQEHQESIFHSIWNWLNFDTDILSSTQSKSPGQFETSYDTNVLSNTGDRLKRETKEDNKISNDESSFNPTKNEYKESSIQPSLPKKYRQGDDEDDAGSGEPDQENEVDSSANTIQYQTTQSAATSDAKTITESNSVEQAGNFDEKNIYRISMTIKEPYREEFERREEEKFKNFAENLTNTVEGILRQHLRKDHHVTFVKMENAPDPFESHVHLDVHTMSSEADVREVLEKHINTYYSLGKFTVNPLTFRLRAVLGCQPGEIACDVSRCILKTQRCDFKSDCEDGSDEVGCKYPTCAPEDFMCNNGQCIEGSLYCDNQPDCLDGSDETNCLTTCSTDEYRCLEGICISIDKRCNGHPDCRNGDDEDSCDCRNDDFYCEDGNCVSYSSLCNGVQDCKDGSDERDCDFAPCPSTDFTCGDRSCISKELVCDGIDHCLGAEDELSCERECTPMQFKCVSGNKCIERVYRCDGHPDCPDRSDEDCHKGFSNGSITHDTSSLSKCRPGGKPCENGVCISKDFFCDGNKDCLDNSDEIDCNTQTTDHGVIYSVCASDEFECSPGICINRLDLCNGRADCPDGRDERSCSQYPHHGGDNKRLNIKVYPMDQIIKEKSEVVFQCRDEGPLRARVRWVRANGRPLPPGSHIENGRLEIPNIQLDHSGSYTCEAENYSHLPGYQVTAQLTVEKVDQSWFPSSKVCRQDQATCLNEECIPKHYVCDGKSDCSDGSDEVRCGHHGCEPNEFRCANKQCVSKVWRCDGDKDCTDGSDEENCAPSPYNSPCNYGEFKCASDQCIPKSYHCDHERDCLDGSDEIGCSPVYIVKPPPPMVVLDPGDTLSLTCTAIGVPIPEINWRLNWGHIPQKCSTESTNGTGTIDCPDIRIEDQGAYSCEGINVMGFVIATPDTILVVKNTSVCPLGKFNAEAKRPEECISCFCFGVATECSSANLFAYQIPLPVDRYKVVAVETRPRIRIQTETNFTETVPTDNDENYFLSLNHDINKNSIIYFGLPEHFHGNQLKSHGGYLHFNVKYNGNGINNDAPFVIISGNDLIIYHNGPTVLPNQESYQKVRFIYGEWYKQDRRGPVLASREDIMMVLVNIDNILIKAQYENSVQLNVSITNVMLDSARSTGIDLATFIEECRCPAGYTGLSCENCAPGYNRRKSGRWLGQCYREAPPSQCPRTFYGDPSRGISCEACPCPIPNKFDRTCHLDIDGVRPKCDCPPGYEGKQCERCSEGYRGNPMRGEECIPYEQCDRSGSLSSEVDPYTRRCKCKEYVTGSMCNQCKANTFSLAPTNQFGCIGCFCMGTTDSCVASNWHRSEIRVAFTSASSARGFVLIGSSDHDSAPISSGINLKLDAREIVFNDFPDRGVGDVYYWQLPNTFLGNQITAYGGNLKYIVRYVPSPGGLTSRNSAADVELISSNDITLLYYSRELPEPNNPKTFSVPMLEQYWQRSDGTKADREHLLMALADVEAIRIKATYTTHTSEAALSFVSLDIAEEFNTGKQRAIEVEKCNCPPGYQGLSCEDCAVGYTRAIEGLYLGICEPCRCNGHSQQCDPENGICENCADHTTGDNCELCESGYEGDATRGSSYDCQVKNGSVIPCNCNPLGSQYSGCVNGQCHCKRNVEGPECNRCIPSTFGLSKSNPDGCNECFCSGVTDTCHESSLYIQQIPIVIYDNQHGFSLTDSSRREIIRDGFELNLAVNEIGYKYTDDRNKRLFWSLPSAFTGNKIKSYGGNLALTQHIMAQANAICRKDQDVILIGNGLTLYWTNPENVTPGSTLIYSVPLKESEWRHLSSSGLRVASRSDLMTVLANVDTILVRASYCEEMVATYISDVSLDTAAETVSGLPRATQVEACRCPQGYTGTSCETCAPGFYRNGNDRSVSTFGSCSPCPCNGHEQSCELDWTGQVRCNCHSQYTGQYCQHVADHSYPPTSAPSTTTQPSPIAVKIREPRIQIVKIGDSVRYHCSARSLTNEPVTVKWEKEGGYLPAGRGIDDSNGILFIREVKVSDSGNYICHVTDGVHVQIEKVTLHVGDSTAEPIITINPPYLKVVEGDPAEFYCKVIGPPQSSVEWVRSDGRMNPNATSVGGILRLPSVTLDDAAEYKCVVRSHKGITEKPTQLHVKAITHDPSVEPDVVLLISPSKWSGFSGDTVRLYCNTSKPVQKLVWSRSDRLLLPTAATQNNGVLSIVNPSLSDAGWYICTATLHDGTEKSTTTSITVNPRHDMPTISIEPQRQKVSQGSVATIQCRVEGDGSTVTWIKNREPSLGANVQAVGNTLRINNAQVANRGIYTCRFTQHNQGSYEASAIVEVEPREMPILQIHPKESQKILEGGTADFHCRAIAGIPAPEIKWSRQDNRPLDLNTQIIPGGMLRINNVTSSNAGSYVCVAENPVGVTSATVNLEVQSLPVITISPRNGILRLKSGEKLHLICSATGYPQPTVSWSKDYNEQPVIDPYESRASGPSATIDINAISTEDEGTYVCRASSPAGTIEDYVQLRIEDEINSVDYPDNCRGDTCYKPPEENIDRDGGLLVDRLSNIPSGGKVSMRCQLFPKSQAYLDDKSIYLDWKRDDGRPMPRESTVNEGTLFISDLKKEDSGDYTCFGIDGYGKEVFSAKTQLNVIDFPKVELRPTKQTVRPGDSPSIHCIASGEQPLNVEWEAVGRPLPPSVRQSNGELQFYSITFADAGKYVCKAWNDLGTAESVAEVSVEATATPIVRVQASKNPANVGDIVYLHCVTSGIVNPRYVWSMPYEVSLPLNAKQSGNILSLIDVEPRNSGVYRCAIDSDEGFVEDDITLQIQDDEYTTDDPYGKPLEIKYVLFGKDIKLPCRDHLQPPARYQWTKTNGSLPVRHEVLDNTLYLNEVEEDASGTYSCRANNGQDSTETFTTVVVTGLVPYFSQAPLSFIELPPLDVYLRFNIEISFRPESPDGVLLYTSENSDPHGDFLSLTLENSFPVLKFDLGSGPVVIKADKNITLRDWHTIAIRRNRKEGEMILDEQYTYTSTSRGKKDGLDVHLPLYVGGISDKLIVNEDAGIHAGFVGCINKLIIGGKQINLMNSKVASQSITSCEICERLDNPCINGVCRESTAKDGYECMCNVGYFGDRCQHTRQFCQPGICGDGMCSETDSGYECDCPIGKTGPNCEYSQLVRTPKLSHPRSYLAYATPKSLRRLKVSFSFKVSNIENGILIYCAQNSRGVGNFIALIIYNRKLKFIFDMGTGVNELNSNYTIDPGKWHHVNVSRDYKMASLTINSEPPIKKSCPDSSHSMSLKTLVYFGGVNRKKISINKNIKVKIPFNGCLDKITLHYTKSDVYKSFSESVNIQECYPVYPSNMNTQAFITPEPTTEGLITRIDNCLSKPCVHGLCQNVNSIEYSCTCEYGYVGRNCENILKQCELLSPCLNGGTCTNLPGSYKCDCRYGFTGQNCSKSADVVEDVTFQGDGWLELGNALMTHEDEREMIGFEISTNETNGLILWHSDLSSERNSCNYISLAVIDGYIEFQYSLGSDPAILRITSMKIDDGRRHRIILKRHGRDGSIELDGEHIEIGTSNGHNTQLEISGNVFLGGVPDFTMTREKYHIGFSGCIHTLEVQDSGAINLGKCAIKGKNVAPCTRVRWIPSSLVFTDAGEDLFDAFIPPPPVNIIHPKPTVNTASIFTHRNARSVVLDRFSMIFLLKDNFVILLIIICNL